MKRMSRFWLTLEVECYLAQGLHELKKYLNFQSPQESVVRFQGNQAVLFIVLLKKNNKRRRKKLA
jgi:hypothetical protein